MRCRPSQRRSCMARQHRALRHRQHGNGIHQRDNYTIFSAPPLRVACRSSIRPAMWLRATCGRSRRGSIYPTEILRLQSTSIKNIALNGDFRYSVGNSQLANYYENFNGSGWSDRGRSATITGSAIAQRRVVALDYGMTWHATKTISLADQVTLLQCSPAGQHHSTRVPRWTRPQPRETRRSTTPGPLTDRSPIQHHRQPDRLDSTLATSARGG